MKLRQVRQGVKLSRRRLRNIATISLRWWRLRHQQWGWWWRFANGITAVLIVASITIPIINTYLTNKSYALSNQARQLVGTTDTKLIKQLSWDSKINAWQFNPQASTPVIASSFKSVMGTSQPGHGAYSLTVPEDLSKGITYTDTNSGLSFSMIPEFKTKPGRVVDGHLVYPLASGKQAIYTLKDNGLKEDLFVPRADDGEMNFYYKFKLPKTLAVKSIPDSNGAIGIYSADPTLYTNISYGSDQDQQTVQKARENAEKTYLVFALPAPVAHMIDGHTVSTAARANLRYELFDDQLVVIADDLTVGKPTSIDPSIIVTSASDFQTSGNNDSNITFDRTNNQIGRTSLTGGTPNTWQATTTLIAAREGLSAVAYNGYLYMFGGKNANGSTYYNDVQYAPINSDGTIGAWQTTTSFTTARSSLKAAIYNGYAYIFGGVNGSTYYNDVQYAPINSDGTIGAWQTTTSFTTARSDFGFAVYNNYFYIVGGKTASGNVGDAQYASLNANGAIGTWSATTSFTATIAQQGMTAYNGYIYMMASTSTNGTLAYTSIHTNGTLGTWQTATTTIPTGRYASNLLAYGGYLYALGGNNSLDIPTKPIYYAPLYANGTIGAWQSVTGYYAAASAGVALYNGTMYMLGGATVLGSTDTNIVAYGTIGAAGLISPTSTSSATMHTQRGGQAVVANGYLYTIGGDAGSAPVTTITAAPLSADGSLGTATTTGMTALPVGLTFFAATAYNNYLYVLGGCTSAYNSCTTAANNTATVYMAAISSTGTIGSWSAQTAFTTARYGLSAVISNGTIYIMGGLNGSTFKNDVQYHTLALTGAISGSWTTSAKTLPTATAYQAAVAYNGYLYVAGGCSAGATTCTTALNTVASAAIGQNGGTYADLGSDLTSNLSTVGNGAFTNARGMFGIAVMNGVLYLMGGRNNTTYYNDIQSASLGSTGAVGSWTTSASTLTSNRYGFGLAAYGTTMYAVGGYDGSAYSNAVLMAQSNNGGGGTLGSWQATTATVNSRTEAGVMASNGYLYMLGGKNGSTTYADVYYAPINSNGTIGSWTATTSFTNGRASFGIALYNDYIYILGGYAGSTYYNDVQYAPINSDGTIGAWQTTTSFTTARSAFKSFALNGYLYVLGGSTNGSAYYNSVQYAPVNANGTIGSWTGTSSLPTNRASFASTVYGGYVYVIGGYDEDRSYYTVTYAPVNANGTIGSWKTTTNFLAYRSNMVAVAYGGYLYLLGGYGSTTGTYYNDVQYAPVNANGTIGNWQAAASFTTGRTSLGAVAYNGYMYVLNGNGTSSAYYSDVQYAAINSIARTARYSKLLTFSTPVNITGISYGGTADTRAVTIMYRAAGSNNVFDQTSAATALSGVGGCIGSTTYTTALYVSVTLDDSSGLGTSGGFLDSNSTPATMTDLTVSYNPVHPQPNIRLRNGQTLQQGITAPLDTCS